jgi:hypothetical protein
LKDTKFHENDTLPFPQQRLEWYLNVGKEAIKRPYNKIKNCEKNNPYGLITLSEAVGIVFDTDFPGTTPNDPLYYTYMNAAKSNGINLEHMYNWQLYKQIYKFSDELVEVLQKDTDDKVLPIRAISDNLPYPAFFIDNIIKGTDGIEYRGVFVSLELSRENRPELSLFFLENTPESDYRYCFIPLYYDDKSLEDIYKERDKEFDIRPDLPELMRREVSELVRLTMPLIVYICSQDAEVERIKVNAAAAKPANKKKGQQKKKTVNKNLVGYRLGNQIKHAKKIYLSNKSNSTGTGTSKVPHIRRGHYHSYWTGSRSEPEKRKLIIKYLPPIYVNKDISEELVPTVHKVK